MKHTVISLPFLVFIEPFDARAQSRNSNQCSHAGRAYQRLPLMADTPTEAEVEGEVEAEVEAEAEGEAGAFFW